MSQPAPSQPAPSQAAPSQAAPSQAAPAARVITGFTPSGPLHIGALLAVIEPLRERSRDVDTLVFVSDLHALTLRHDPRELGARRSEVAALLIACGLDDADLFMQSEVPPLTDLHYLLESTATYGEVQRMVQFKEKARAQASTGARLSLLSYPVLMAADILAYGVTEVPVGADQVQHLELTRELARRFNAAYGETFVVPAAVVQPDVARVMDLVDPTVKMSKSNPSQRGVLRLLDEPDVLRAKISRAVTDTDGDVRFDPASKPGVSNLLTLLGAITGRTPGVAADGLRGYADLKAAVAEAVIERVRPIQQRYAELSRGAAGVDHRLDQGRTRAVDLAGPRVSAAARRVGLGGRRTGASAAPRPAVSLAT